MPRLSPVAVSAVHIPLSNRSRLAMHRAELARGGLANCHFCAHHCGVDRTQGQTGPCQARTETRYFSAQTEVSDESELSPTFSIALGGCDLRCAFCITRQQSWSVTGGRLFVPEEIARAARRALGQGARTIMILGGEPTIHLHTALELVSHLPEEAALIWKTSGHGSAQARALLQGLFNYWVVDYKFGNDECAARLAGYPNYLAPVRENLVWAGSQAELIIRHLVMPGHVECCWRPVADWIANHLPGAKVNLRTGFWPAPNEKRRTELRRYVADQEAETAGRIAQEFGLNLVV